MDVRDCFIALALGALIGAGGSWYLTKHYLDAEHNVAIEVQKVEAGKQLQAATEKAATHAADVAKLREKIEVDDGQNKASTAAQLAENQRLARKLGGLRDPGYRPRSDCPVQAGSGATGQPQESPAAGFLSERASDFLLDFANRCDAVADYAAACYRWANGVSAVK